MTIDTTPTGLQVLLDTSFEYERAHQLVLATLLTHSRKFASTLLGITSPLEVQVEGERMDLLLTNAGNKAGFIELKFRSTLYPSQIRAHRQYIEQYDVTGFYLLLSYSSFEYNQEDLEKEIHPNAKRLSYEELDEALNAVLECGTETQAVKEIAAVYRELLEGDRRRSLDTSSNNDNHRLHRYAVFSEIKKHLKMKTRMYDAGFDRIVLNPWDILHTPVSFHGLESTFFFEIENSRVVVKFQIPTDDIAIKDRLREVIFEECKNVFPALSFKKGRKPTKLKPKVEGKTYPYFTACSTTSHDFAELTHVETSAKLFSDIHDGFPELRQRVLSRL